MQAQLLPAAAGIALLLAPGAFAQGSDNCSNAPSISGLGTFGFNTQNATDSPGDPCAGIGRDVWFSWTAPSAGSFQISTCGLASFDTALAAYSNCSNALTCNDDSCDLQSRITFAAQMGDSILIRVGSYEGNSGGSGSIEISVAPPSSCDNPASGPDVIVGEIPGISNFGSANGMGGYSLGTTSCNTGTAELLWIASNNQHPVIGQNIYRAENGRFEMVGMGWLKHGFTALQGNLCCSCNDSGNGSRLGVGCSDPYGSSLNGSQTGLGPRFQVNAFTGAFPYPFFAQGQSGDRSYKRVQVPNDDVDPSLHPTATYYGEAQYITPDDAAAGNGFNNVSWCNLSRPGSTVNGAWRLNIGGATNREEPAIYGWPGATIAEINVPNEGQFVAGSRVIDNGNGTWTYNYAVFNNNSDYSGQSFSVPVGGASVTDVGMSFPHYHSGEPYSNLDWTSTLAGGELTWQSETFAQDQNGNALRWGTMYSFWFTSDAAPSAGNATLGLFKPGNPGDQTVGLDIPDPSGGSFSQMNYCQGVANSSGQIGGLIATSVDLPGRSFDLAVTSLPTNVFGMVATSLVSDFLPGAGGSTGNLCLGGAIGRAVGGVIFDSSFFGAAVVPVDMDMISTPGPFVAIQPGETRYFQGWFRDVTPLGTSTSNYTVGLEMTFP